jgi:hypothetical protein
MSESPTKPADDGLDASDLWTEIQEDVTAVFGDDVELTVTEYEDHLDLRLMPNGAVSEIEAEHDSITIVPYNACQMTIRTDD